MTVKFVVGPLRVTQPSGNTDPTAPKSLKSWKYVWPVLSKEIGTGATADVIALI